MLTKKIATAIATGAVLLNALAPMTFAATTDVVSGNGTDSQNQINTTSNNNTSVSQSNNANISNTVVSKATTGGNEASANTGGNTTVTSGSAGSSVSVTNAANQNSASVSNCGCQNGGDTVGIIGNGSDSANRVNAKNNNSTDLTQTNNANISNEITSTAKTGDNEASANTGGNTTVRSGAAGSDVSVANAANVNAAQIGSGTGSTGSNGGDTVLISGNGEGSQNTADTTDNNSVSLGQSNSARILNSVFSTAKTGDNEASANTGGNTTVDSGAAGASTHITNEPNFNVASLNDCGCTTTGDLFKVAGNGADSASAIKAVANNGLDVSTTNNEDLNNFAIPTAETGDNNASANTGTVLTGSIDPVLVSSGDTMTQVTVDNAGNSNTVGNGALTLPGFGNVSFTTNFSGMWAQWMAFMSSNNM